MKISEDSLVLRAEHAEVARSSEEITVTGGFAGALARADAALAEPAEAAAASRLRLQQMLHDLLARMLEAITGRKCRCAVLDPASGGSGAALSASPGAAPAAAEGRTFAWQAERRVRIEEAECTAFTAQGTVRTADGRSIAFRVAFQLARAVDVEQVAQAGGRVTLRDPLMLVFAGSAAELSNQRFRFDLDADGRAESLAAPGAGCGFLAFDRDGNGRIDNGRELFGVASGDGFADLAALDEDGNGWIDAGDAAWASLSLWRPEDAGCGRRLTEAGVGALGLARVETPFAFKDEALRTLGQLRSSGVYLREDGGAGLLQQVDLAV